MAFVNPSQPNITDFRTFCLTQGVPEADLPADSDWLAWSFAWAKEWAIYVPVDIPAIVYVMAVYNLGLHQLLKTAQDIPPETFFTDTRKRLGLNALALGIVSSASDNGTGASLVVPQAIQNLTIQGLDLVRTPYGLAYLEYAQAYGLSIVEYS